MKKNYDAMPTPGYLARLTDSAGCAKDSAFLAQTLDAVNTCRKLIEYMREKAKEDSFPETDVLCYLLTGSDWESFCAEAQAEEKD